MTQTAGEGEHSAAYTYDKLGRLTQSIDSMGSPIGITYDNMGNITGITDANGGLTSYEYDKAGNLTREINPLRAENRYTYNARNLLEEAVNAAGETTTYEYDDLGRITSMTDDLGTITYTYDKNSNVLTVEENGATIQRTYDKLNRVTSYTDYQGRTIKYAYDEVGNLISLTYPGGEIVRYEYNPDGSLATVIDGEGHRTEYTYDKNGQKTSIRRPDGTAELYTYDKAGRLTGQADVAEDGTVIQNLFYTYDEYGNLSQKAGMAVPDPTALYLDSRNMQYDANNRLIRYNDNIVRYDSKGNMTYGPLNGEMTQFRYDCRNRLIQAGDTTYTYDAENRRISSTTNGITTEYVINSQPTLDQVLEEYQNHELTAVYQYGNGQLISDRIVQTGTGENHELKERYYHYDNLGSTQALTDENGTILSTYSYGVYGELLSGDTTLTGYLYNGAYGVHTDENGLYYMRARYYNTDISRFINQDILRGNPSASQSLNRYAYCQGNPLNQNDPFGLCPQGMTQKDWIHIGLSIAGMIPVVGVFANVFNAVLYFQEGDILNGAFCIAGALVGTAGIISAIGVAQKACTVVEIAGIIEKAGIMITAAASADMTILSAAKTLVLLHENNYALSGEILLAAGETVMSAMGTMEAFNALDISTRRTQQLLENANCFPAGTKVLTDEGLKDIEDIQPGDYVYSTDDETGESDYKEVLQVFVRETEVIAHVIYENAEGEREDIETTINHRFWSEGTWKSAGTLKAGETLTLSDGSQVIILGVTFEDRHETVYNMEVADYHTYYVGEDSVWVHNTYGRNQGTTGGKRTFYTVQNNQDAERLLGDGLPWPAGAERANLGDGVYAWGDMDDAIRYLERRQGRSSEPLTILQFEINNSDLEMMKTFDTRGLTDDELNKFFNQYAKLYGGTPTHGYDYIINETNMGVEHYFNKTIFDKLHFLGNGG